jgi:hypothetical protein
VAGLITAAGIVSGRLILSLDSGEMIDVGAVTGPKGLTGEKGAIGSTGPAGKDGTGLRHGAGVPLFDDGKDGDFYIDIKEWKAYGPKTGGKWGSGVALLPKDRGHTLPTGMKAQGSGSSSRVFAAGISGPTGYSEVYEVRTGTAPTLHFQTGTTPTGQLTLQVYSETALDFLRGRVLYI